MYASSRIEVGEPPRFAFLARGKAGRFAYLVAKRGRFAYLEGKAGDALLTGHRR